MSNNSSATTSNENNLNKASGYLFLLGFALSKLRQLPFGIVSAALNLISLGLYLGGYALWLIATTYRSDQDPQADKWYGFAEFKEQHQIAAILGLIASVLSILAIFAPVLLVTASWIFLASNVIWTVSEYHKSNNPPQDDLSYSPSHQSTYVAYALTMTAIGFVATFGGTVAFFFPAVALPIVIVSAVLCMGLSILSARYWLELSFGNHQPDIVSESHLLMNKTLGHSNDLESTRLSEPYHGKDIFSVMTNKSSDLTFTNVSNTSCKAPD